MNHSSNTNIGGWADCDLRYDILGSTDTKGADASSNTANVPVSNTLMAALPGDLRSVMKPMTIYTDNTGGGGLDASFVTTTVDYLPLLDEFEIFGIHDVANSGERGYQEQYSYYANGNSKLKHSCNDASTAVYWWGRSPYYRNGRNFFCVGNDGATTYAGVQYSQGLAPIFRV